MFDYLLMKKVNDYGLIIKKLKSFIIYISVLFIEANFKFLCLKFEFKLEKN